MIFDATRTALLLGDVRVELGQPRTEVASDGIRQSPRGDSEPPATTFGPLGSAERLNWLAKKRWTKTSIQCRIVARSYAVRAPSG